MNTLIHKALLPFPLFMSMSAAALAEEPNAAEEADCTGTFSNMYYNLEAGDFLGEEIKIVVGARREYDVLSEKGSNNSLNQIHIEYGPEKWK